MPEHTIGNWDDEVSPERFESLIAREWGNLDEDDQYGRLGRLEDLLEEQLPDGKVIPQDEPGFRWSIRYGETAVKEFVRSTPKDYMSDITDGLNERLPTPWTIQEPLVDDQM